MNSATKMTEDRDEKVPSIELSLLRRIAETSCDMVKARAWEEFRSACGGQEKLDEAHAAAVAEYEAWTEERDG